MDIWLTWYELQVYAVENCSLYLTLSVNGTAFLESIDWPNDLLEENLLNFLYFQPPSNSQLCVAEWRLGEWRRIIKRTSETLNSPPITYWIFWKTGHVGWKFLNDIMAKTRSPVKQDKIKINVVELLRRRALSEDS